MADRTVFLDTSGLFAWVSARDPHHQAMLALPRTEGTRLVLTDYVVDEACALFLVRGIAHRRKDLLRLIKHSKIVSFFWVEREIFWEAWDILERFADQPFSLTDCTSFAVMRKLRITEAATNDQHFRTAGFVPLLG